MLAIHLFCLDFHWFLIHEPFTPSLISHTFIDSQTTKPNTVQKIHRILSKCFQWRWNINSRSTIEITIRNTLKCINAKSSSHKADIKIIDVKFRPFFHLNFSLLFCQILNPFITIYCTKVEKKKNTKINL